MACWGPQSPRIRLMSEDSSALKLVTAVTASVVLALLVLVLSWRPPTTGSRPATVSPEAPAPAIAAMPFGLGELAISRSSTSLRLEGRVNASTRALLIEAARRVHPELELQTEALRVDADAPRLHWQDGLLGPLARLRTIPTYVLQLGEPIRLEATLSSDQGRAAWVDYLSRFATGEALPVDSSGVGIDPLASMRPADPDLLFVWQPDYASGSAALPPAAVAELPVIVELLRLEPGFVRVIGHTDELGDPGSNKSLSGERAEAVRIALRRAGLPADRLVSMGRGQDVPWPDGLPTGDGAFQRRIEFAR